MRILLLAPQFFGYRQRIQNELIKQGHHVDCFDDRPSEGVAFKSLSKISYGLLDYPIGKHASLIRDKAAGSNYDLLLYTGGMSFCFSREQFMAIRKASNARFTAFLWDSFENCKRFGACCDLFDEVFSFEPKDCDRFGFKLRPLFFSEEYAELPIVPEDGFKFDACFIGSVHQPSKFHAVYSICSDLESMGLKVFKYFYMPSSQVEILRKMSDAFYRGVEFKHHPLAASEVASVYLQAKAIIDSPQSGQQGLTMRTLETVGAHRKLITANTDVLNYDISKDGDVALWDGPGSISSEFFNSCYSALSDDVYGGYSIRSFVKTLLGEAAEFQGYKRSN